MLQSVYDCANIHRQSLYCRRFPSCLCVHSRGTVGYCITTCYQLLLELRKLSKECFVQNRRRTACSVLSQTVQVYPTATRALGLGTSSGMARVGALITPFVAQVASSNHLTHLNTPETEKLLRVLFCPRASSCRWCWSPQYTWLSPCTAAAAC